MRTLSGAINNYLLSKNLIRLESFLCSQGKGGGLKSQRGNLVDHVTGLAGLDQIVVLRFLCQNQPSAQQHYIKKDLIARCR